jgi:hypothetical protein
MTQPQVQPSNHAQIQPRLLSATHLTIQPQAHPATQPQSHLRVQSGNHPEGHPRGDPPLPPPFRLTHNDSSGYPVLAQNPHEIEQSHARYRNDGQASEGRNEKERMAEELGWDAGGRWNGAQRKQPESAGGPPKPSGPARERAGPDIGISARWPRWSKAAWS